jgi:hypothetical protein
VASVEVLSDFSSHGDTRLRFSFGVASSAVATFLLCLLTTDPLRFHETIL